MLVETSFGHITLKPWGIRQNAECWADLLTFVRSFGAGVESGALSSKTDLGQLADRIIRRSTDSLLPAEISIADALKILPALWELNDLDNLGKLLALYPQALRVQGRLRT
ncbi:hypothetical protein [Deinococcus marmoris]|uniref:Uncharacterized protein n=1 Tax=Deinococcus marmoris TaxID=249408 RepID=A0A1U7P2Y0_9DEIO|nr:hypothetical protein [Deinococcus marmoris]OLV19533.1 hypothetical protein BOO71_0002338 [Deinococcus marmoris]